MRMLADELASRAPELADRALEVMYRDPFWLERFGERGRGFAAEDGRHHVAYLVEALRADDPRLLREYARWLQSLLTTRGLCTLHVSENFARLRDVIAASVAGDTSLVGDHLAEAQDALTYDDGPARVVQHAIETLAKAAIERDPSLGAHSDGARLERDLRQHGSYLADSIALAQAALFESYARWMASYYERAGFGRALLVRSLDALDGALDVLSDDAAREAARAILTPATSAAREEVP